ncbi:hypothetical protein CALCODRAFT_521382 [Calocera cornea HHB12733]|uniref:Uncharacterized protein n=1 Tax=Calocera cornea HHB12733 TaxID=1353952 RepID=A0A165CUV0_9BASI|nr:hypothetical protein CALCODRAFT_521382 [Calocera cornea HHB12733]
MGSKHVYTAAGTAPAASGSFKEMKEEWTNSTIAGKVLNILFLLTYLSAIAVLFCYCIMVGRLIYSRAPWGTLVQVSGWTHHGSLAFVSTFMAGIKKKMNPQRYQRLNLYVSNWYSAFLLVLWFVPTVVSLNAQPSCDPDSDWWKSLEAIPDRGLELPEACKTSLAIVSLSAANTTILAVIIIVALIFPAEKGQKAPLDGYLKRLLGRKDPEPTPAEEDQALLEVEMHTAPVDV